MPLIEGGDDPVGGCNHARLNGCDAAEPSKHLLKQPADAIRCPFFFLHHGILRESRSGAARGGPRRSGSLRVG
jgi:hypothetical protein